MNIELKSNKTEWLHEGKEIVIKDYFEHGIICFGEKNVLLANKDRFLLCNLDGVKIHDIHIELPKKTSIYILLKTPYSPIGARVVLAHDDLHQGELFWQHEIDFNHKSISNPISKWR